MASQNNVSWKAYDQTSELEAVDKCQNIDILALNLHLLIFVILFYFISFLCFLRFSRFLEKMKQFWKYRA